MSIETLETIFLLYKEACKVLLDDTKIREYDLIDDYAKKAIMNLLHANIDVQIRRLIAEFPKYGIKCIGNMQ